MTSRPPSPSSSVITTTTTNTTTTATSSSSSPSTPVPSPPSQSASARFARAYYSQRPSISTIISSAGSSEPTAPTMEQASPHVFVLPSAVAAKGKAPTTTADGASPSAAADGGTSAAAPSTASTTRSSPPKAAPIVFGAGPNSSAQLRVSPGASMPSPILRPSARVTFGANRRSVGPGGSSMTAPAPATAAAAAPSLRGYTASDWSLLAIQRTSVGLLITLQHRPSEALFAWPMNTVGGTQTGPGQVYITPKSQDPKDAPAPTTTSWSLRVLGDVVSAWVRGPGRPANVAARSRSTEGSGKRRLGEHEGDVLELAQQLGLHPLPEDVRRSTLARQKIEGVTLVPSPVTTPGTGPGEAPRRNEAAAAALVAARRAANLSSTSTATAMAPSTASSSSTSRPAAEQQVSNPNAATDPTAQAKAPKKKESFSALRALKGLRPSSAAGLVSSMTGSSLGSARRESRRTASTTEVGSSTSPAATTVTNSGSSSSASSIGSIFSSTKRPSSTRTGSTSSAVSSIPAIEISESGGLEAATVSANLPTPAAPDASSPTISQPAKERERERERERGPRPFSLTAWNSSGSSLLKGNASRPRRGSSNSSIATAVASSATASVSAGQRSDSTGRTQVAA